MKNGQRNINLHTESVFKRQNSLTDDLQPNRLICSSSLSADANLLDDVDAVVKLLFLEERMDVTKECSQVRVAVSIWNNECHSMARLTGPRSPHTTDVNVVVKSFQLVVRQRRVTHVDEADCTRASTTTLHCLLAD